MPHIHDAIDFTVEVFIIYQNKVLLRKHDKYGIWLSIGGHIEPNEDPNQAAVREVKEEVGLDIALDESLRQRNDSIPDFQELIPPYFLNRHRVTPTHEHVTLTYFATANNNKIEELSEKEKSQAYHWFTKEELESNPEIRSNIKYYALHALKQLSKK